MKAKPVNGHSKGTRFMAAAGERFHDMRQLLRSGRTTGAVYLGGYVLECFLKYLITKRLKRARLPAEYESGAKWHDISLLLKEAALSHIADQKMTSAFSAITDEWGPDLRYSPEGMALETAKQVCNLIEQCYEWLKDQEER